MSLLKESKKTFTGGILLAIVIGWTLPAWGGETVWGKVTDTQGQSIVGAQVQFKDEADTNRVFSDFTDAAGMYNIFLGTNAVEDEMGEQAVARDFTLLQSYPNPFNPSTIIPYRLRRNARVRIKIYNVLGQSVRTLVDAYHGVGQHRVVWDGRDEQGISLSAGVYFSYMEVDGYVQTRKIVMLDVPVGAASYRAGNALSMPKQSQTTGVRYFTVSITRGGIKSYREEGIEVTGDTQSDFVVEREIVDLANLSFTFMSEIASVGDVGDFADPALADLDGDNDLDMVVGAKDGKLNAFYNAGDRRYFVFLPESKNFNLNFNPGSNSSPAFCDLDSDGDYDLFVGLSYGTIKGYRNTGNSSYPKWTEDNNLTLGIGDVGSYAQPAFADLDGDGDYDLFVGENDESRISGFRNIGSSTTPLWSQNSDLTATIPVNTDYVYSAPAFADLDFDCDPDFVYASVYRYYRTIVYVTFYERTSTFLDDPAWRYFLSLEISALGNYEFRDYQTLDMADIDGDGDSDMVLGNYRGKVFYFRNDTY